MISRTQPVGTKTVHYTEFYSYVLEAFPHLGLAATQALLTCPRIKANREVPERSKLMFHIHSPDTRSESPRRRGDLARDVTHLSRKWRHHGLDHGTNMNGRSVN